MLSKLISLILLISLGTIYTTNAEQPNGMFFAMVSPNKYVAAMLIILLASSLVISYASIIKNKVSRLLAGSAGLILLLSVAVCFTLKGTWTGMVNYYFEPLDMLALAGSGVVLCMAALGATEPSARIKFAWPQLPKLSLPRFNFRPRLPKLPVMNTADKLWLSRRFSYLLLSYFILHRNLQ